MDFSAEVWGPHYWFFLFTVAYFYPRTPNEITKRKYYDLVQNMPLFIPDEEIGNRFSHMLDLYPVSPYLVGRDSFLRWVWFIHNKVNIGVGLPEIAFEDAIDRYLAKYRPREVVLSETLHIRKSYLHVFIVLICLCMIWVWWPK